MKYLYESGSADDPVATVLNRIEDTGTKVIDTESWDEDHREDVYFRELMPLSVKNQKRLRGRLRTHQAGRVTFNRGVLITDDDFYVGDDALTYLDSELVGGEDGE